MPVGLSDMEMAVRFGHTQHCVGQHTLQTLDSPKDLYVHSVTHTETPVQCVKGVMEEGDEGA